MKKFLLRKPRTLKNKLFKIQKRLR